jgi:hypothetical protein
MSSASDRPEFHRQLLDRVVETLFAAHCGGPSAHGQLERTRAELKAFDTEPAVILSQGVGAA